MEIKFKKNVLIVFAIMFFHIMDCFFHEVYSISVFGYIKNLVLLCFLIYCMLEFKINKNHICLRELREILFMIIAFLVLSIYQMMKNETWNIIPFLGSFRVIVPAFLSFYLVNMYKMKEFGQLIKVIFCLSFAFYVFSLLMTDRFNLDSFNRLTLSTFNGVTTESDLFSPLSMGLCIFLCSNEKRKIWKVLSLIFVIMTNKRIMILYAFILVLFGRFFLKKNVSNRIKVITGIVAFLITVFYIRMNLQIIDDTIIQKIFKVNLDSFAMGRAWLYRTIYHSSYLGAGFQTLNSIKFVPRGAEMDFPNMYLEMGLLSIAVCIFIMLRLSRNNLYNYVIVTFVIVEMITSHFIDITYFWIFFYVTIMYINKNNTQRKTNMYEIEANLNEENTSKTKSIDNYTGI